MLQNQIAVVTGASRGIGRAIARRLASLGAHVVLCARHRQDLDRLAEELHSTGQKATVFPLDLTQATQVDALAQAVREQFQRCDIVVNNAGLGQLGPPLHQTSPQDWDRLMAVNLRGPFLMIRAFAPLMIERGSGHIINISSLAGHNPLKNGAAYAASKWGLNGLTYSVAEELRDHGIRVSVIAPGSVNTEFGGKTPANAGARLQPGDIADVVALLVQQRRQSFVSEVLMRPARKP